MLFEIPVETSTRNVITSIELYMSVPIDLFALLAKAAFIHAAKLLKFSLRVCAFVSAIVCAISQSIGDDFTCF